MVSEIQGECVLSETILPGLCDFDDLIQNVTESELVDESVVRRYGRMGHLGDSERRTEADNRVHRERNHDGAVLSSSAVDIRREDRKRLEGDTVAKRKDSVHLLDKH